MIGWHFSLGGVVDGEDHFFEILRIMLEKMISRVTKTTQREQILHQEWHSNSRREDFTHPAFSAHSFIARRIEEIFTILFGEIFRIPNFQSTFHNHRYLQSCSIPSIPVQWTFSRLTLRLCCTGESLSRPMQFRGRVWEQKILVLGLTKDLTHPTFKTRTLYHQKNKEPKNFDLGF